MSDELSVSGAHTSQSCRLTLTAFLCSRVCTAVRIPSLPLRREERLTWKVGAQDLGVRSKAGMSSSPQSKHLHRAHRGVLFLPACLLIIWLSPVIQADIITIPQVLPLLLFAFDCKCQRRHFLTFIHVLRSFGFVLYSVVWGFNCHH